MSSTTTAARELAPLLGRLAAASGTGVSESAVGLESNVDQRGRAVVVSHAPTVKSGVIFKSNVYHSCVTIFSVTHPTAKASMVVNKANPI